MLSDVAAQKAQFSYARDRSISVRQALVTNRRRSAAPRWIRHEAHSRHGCARWIKALRQQAERAAREARRQSMDTAGRKAPEYLTAHAKLEEAQRQLDHTMVQGAVRRHRHPGGVAAEGREDHSSPWPHSCRQAPSACVGHQELWVEANIKETDLQLTCTRAMPVDDRRRCAARSRLSRHCDGDGAGDRRDSSRSCPRRTPRATG